MDPELRRRLDVAAGFQVASRVAWIGEHRGGRHTEQCKLFGCAHDAGQGEVAVTPGLLEDRERIVDRREPCLGQELIRGERCLEHPGEKIGGGNHALTPR